MYLGKRQDAGQGDSSPRLDCQCKTHHEESSSTYFPSQCWVLGCLHVFLTWQLASSRKSDPKDQGGSRNILSGLAQQSHSMNCAIFQCHREQSWKIVKGDHTRTQRVGGEDRGANLKLATISESLFSNWLKNHQWSDWFKQKKKKNSLGIPHWVWGLYRHNYNWETFHFSWCIYNDVAWEAKLITVIWGKSKLKYIFSVLSCDYLSSPAAI